MTNNEPDVIFGNIYSIKILLSHADETIFCPVINEMSTFVLSKKDKNNDLIRRKVIETIPILAKYGK